MNNSYIGDHVGGTEAEDPESTRSSGDLQKELIRVQLDRLQRVCVGSQVFKDAKGQEHVSNLSNAEVVQKIVSGCTALANLLIADQDPEFVRKSNSIISKMNHVSSHRERGGAFDVMQTIRKSMIESDPDSAMSLALDYHRLVIGLCQRAGFLDSKRKVYGYKLVDGKRVKVDSVSVADLPRVGLITRGKDPNDSNIANDYTKKVWYVERMRGNLNNSNAVIVICQKCGEKWVSVKREEHGAYYFNNNLCSSCGSHDVVGNE